MATTPEAMNCPSCGAPVPADATQCGHCGARLATVACPSCFGMVFVGAKYCSHCGAAIEREQVAPTTEAICPRCEMNMDAVVIGNTNLRECPKCEGIWADKESLQKICEDREQQAAVLGGVLGGANPLPEEVDIETKVRYLRCPICRTFMNRVNFAHCSHVIVDVCRAHGTWFDKDELRRIVEFIRSGGMEKARGEEIAELERRRKALQATQMAGGSMEVEDWRQEKYRGVGTGLASVAGTLITSLLGLED